MLTCAVVNSNNNGGLRGELLGDVDVHWYIGRVGRICHLLKRSSGLALLEVHGRSIARKDGAGKAEKAKQRDLDHDDV